MPSIVSRTVLLPKAVLIEVSNAWTFGVFDAAIPANESFR